jgi:SAM-dependent methyltransferase
VLRYKFEAPLDSVERVLEHRKIIRSKPFLKKIYLQWYHQIAREFAGKKQSGLLEIGSGGGFIKEVLPDIITSDIQPIEGVDQCFPAQALPFDANSLQGICMVNVFHHIPDPAAFLHEAYRVLRKDGVIVMTEPANTIWGRFIYKKLHHENHDTKAGWKFPEGSPMSNANVALPWIVFFRDRKLFESRFPGFTIGRTRFHTSFLYLLSGGVSFRQLVPGFLFKPLLFFDNLLCRISPQFAMFLTIKIHKSS